MSTACLKTEIVGGSDIQEMLDLSCSYGLSTGTRILGEHEMPLT